MGINSLTFGNVNTADYGVYISGEAAFNAPGRVYDSYSVPGRNGQIIVDQGHYENIEVTYPAFVFDYDQETFATRMAEIRSAFLSQTGYVRLSDTYNTDEYRLAYYSGGFEVEPQHFNQTGEFELVFNCKPQRFLTSGDTAVTMPTSGTITNPTLFDAKPILEVYGYGIASINGKNISVVASPIGMMQIDTTDQVPITNGWSKQLNDNTSYNTGDDLILRMPNFGIVFIFRFNDVTEEDPINYSDITITVLAGDYTAYLYSTEYASIGASGMALLFMRSDLHFNANEDGQHYVTLNIDIARGNLQTLSTQLSVYVNYSAQSNTISITYNHVPGDCSRLTTNCQIGDVWVDSTKSSLGDPIYIDLEVGEAWNNDYEEPISVNNSVTLPANLPVLHAGSNTVTCDASFHGDIIPRWWRL